MDILFFAAIAVLVVFRLFSVMGTRDEEMIQQLRRQNVDGDYPLPGSKQPTVKEVNIVLEPLVSKDAEPSVVRTVQAVNSKQPDFNEKFFLEGAQNALEMILKAFSSHDRNALRALVEEPVYQQFEQAIIANEQAGEFPETTLVGIKKAELVRGNLYKNIASLSVKFISEQISIIRDQSKKIVSGDPSLVQVVEDIWTFHRQLDKDGIDWKLAATSRVQ